MTSETPEIQYVCRKCGRDVTFNNLGDDEIKFFKCDECGMINETKVEPKNIEVPNIKYEPPENPTGQNILIQRLKEVNLSARRFLKVGKNKAAFELEWEKHLYGPEDLPKYPRWGICGKDGLVLCDVDKPEMIKVFREQLPATLVVVSPRRGLPHFYYKVVGGEVPNKTLHISGDYDEKGRLRGAGEIRSQNEYLVAPGTTIKYKDLKTGEPKIGTYKITENRPIAMVTFERFMEVIKPYLGKDSSQKITKEIMENGVAQGTRHAYGIKYATRLIRYEHLDPVAALDILKRWNQKCKPPMNEKDLERMIRNAVGYAQNDPQEIFGNDFHLERIGKSVFLLDSEGGAVASCKMKNVDGRDFKKTLKDIIGLEDHEINKITANFQLKHQKHNKKTEKKEKPKEIDFEEEIEKKARELLRDPAFFYKLGWVFKRGFIVSKLNKPRFVIGEERNKRLIGPILIGAAKLGMTSLTKLLGEPATGKDTMLRMWLDLLPIKSVERSFFTAAGLRYSQEMKDADLLYIPDSPELHGEMGRQMRFMRADDGGLISEYATRDAETGEMVTKISRLPVKAIATTSNALTGDAALESGMWTLRTNATEELTKEVKKEKLKLRAGKRELFPEDELKIWRCAFKILVSEEVPDTLPEVPFAEQLIVLLESGRSASRRDPDKLCDLISLIAWVRRFQKNLDERDEADLIDLYSALQVGLDAITQTISELDEKEERIFKAIGESSATIRAVTEDTKIPYETCYRYLERLVQKGFLNKDHEKGKNIYSILGKNKPKQLFVSEVKSSEDPATLMKFILESFKDSSTLHGGREVLLIDPLTGNEVRVNTTENNEVTITAENRSYTYPYEELKTFERSEETPSEVKKESKQVVIREIKRENEEKPVETPVSETGANGGLNQLLNPKCSTCRLPLPSPELRKKIGKTVFCFKCYEEAKNKPVCVVCHDPILDLKDLSNIDGEPTHKKCAKVEKEASG